MNPDIKRRWCERLRSDIKQIRHRLNDGIGLCCLGVLCEVGADYGIVQRRRNVDGSVEYLDPETDFPSYLYLPMNLTRWAELTRIDGDIVSIGGFKRTLVDHNAVFAFSEIATAIELKL